MMELLTGAVVVLWVLVVVLGVVVFALARQIGVLYERVAPAGALMINQQLKVGDAAPQIGVETLNGLEITAGDVAGRGQLLFFLAPDCPICKSLLPVLKTLQRAEKDIEVLLVSDGGTLEEHQAFVNDEDLHQFNYAISEIVGRSYGVGKLPYGVLINERGLVASLGIVNSREHLESLFEAERMGVASIQEYLGGGSVSGDELHYNAAEEPAEKAK